MPLQPRKPLRYLIGIWVVIALGLASRRYAAALPEFIATYAGDTLWAVMVFGMIAMVATGWSTLRVAAATLIVTCAIEISQLYQAPWIESLRQSGPAGLVLGYGFLWSDIICYAVGTAICVAIELRVRAST